MSRRYRLLLVVLGILITFEPTVATYFPPFASFLGPIQTAGGVVLVFTGLRASSPPSPVAGNKDELGGPSS